MKFQLVKMGTIYLREIINQTEDYAISGSVVFEEAKKAIREDVMVILDLNEVDSVPTTFMNTSFGALMDEYGANPIKSLFKFRNIKQTQIDRIRKYFHDYENVILNKDINNSI